MRPRQGDFGIPDARIVAPGDPHRSVLFYRMAKFGRGRMPHLGSEWPDADGLELIDEWIGSLGTRRGSRRATAADRGWAWTTLGQDVGAALPFARVLGGQMPTVWSHARSRDAAAKLEPGPVRDLFEGYLPPDPKGRKLGSNPRPSSILSLTGDAKKGEALFFNKEMKCANCHKVGDKGASLGPDLTAIGKTRSRANLLESLLQPSLRVEPQFAAYLVRTKDEKTVTGLLVKRDDKQVIVRDAENKEHTFAAGNVESVTPSRVSLMPDGQMSGADAAGSRGFAGVFGAEEGTMIRPATPDDVPTIARLIRDLAEYERLAHAVDFDGSPTFASTSSARRSTPRCCSRRTPARSSASRCSSTTTRPSAAKPGIYLEDLFVEPEHRGKGHGKALLIALAKLAVERDCCSRRVVGAELERAVDSVLQGARREADGRMDGVSAHRRRA